jgi:hypothetical protein
LSVGAILVSCLFFWQLDGVYEEASVNYFARRAFVWSGKEC